MCVVVSVSYGRTLLNQTTSGPTKADRFSVYPIRIIKKIYKLKMSLIRFLTSITTFFLPPHIQIRISSVRNYNIPSSSRTRALEEGQTSQDVTPNKWRLKTCLSTLLRTISAYLSICTMGVRGLRGTGAGEDQQGASDTKRGKWRFHKDTMHVELNVPVSLSLNQEQNKLHNERTRKKLNLGGVVTLFRESQCHIP